MNGAVYVRCMLRTLRSWGTESRLNIAEYFWILSMFGLLPCLDDRMGLYLIPPFGATLTILIGLPEAQGAQPMPGSQVLLSELPSERYSPVFARIRDGHPCSSRSFGIINLIHAYHPPGVALRYVSLAASSGPLLSSDRSSPFHRGCSREAQKSFTLIKRILP
jgi:hypothetical protein